MTKHEAVKAYLEPICQELAQGALGFNFSPESEDSMSIITRYSGKVVRYFIDDTAEKEYGFSVIIEKIYSTDTGDDLNLLAMNFAQGFMDWLDTQNKDRNFPDFEGCEVIAVENLQNMPNLAAVNPEEGLARYMVQGRILYREDV
ncbi:MAG TPA: hypothetical protein DHV42_02380 [Lachnospiraceae bacterium]|nr:hypothetical protein [Lachnospiraceae bacterium]